MAVRLCSHCTRKAVPAEDLKGRCCLCQTKAVFLRQFKKRKLTRSPLRNATFVI
ncbi:hypothetical protein IW148_005975 [Coemansia sp. RSA 1199]|nr:hypothetical protein IW148_005975 [Coemansia sp. RSA 1199]